MGKNMIIVNLIILIMILSILPTNTYAAAPSASFWMKGYGGGNDEEARSVIYYNNYLYIIGYTESFGSGGKDIGVLKLESSTGNIVWFRVYGTSSDDWPNGALLMSNGNIAIVGSSTSTPGGDQDGLLLIIEPSNGSIVLSKIYGGSSDDWFMNAVEYGSNLVLVGSTESFGQGRRDIWIVSVDENTGGVNWQKAYGTSYNDYVNDASMIPPDTIIIASSNSYDAAIFWVNASSGDFITGERYGGSRSEWFDALAYMNGVIVAAGPTRSFGAQGGRDLWVVEINASTRNVVWAKIFPTSSYDWINKVVIDSDGSIYVSADTRAFTGNTDAWLLKLNGTNGSIIWSRVFGGSSSEWLEDILVEGNYIIGAGPTLSFSVGGSDFLVLRVNKNHPRIPGCPYQSGAVVSDLDVTPSQSTANLVEVSTSGSEQPISLASNTYSLNVTKACLYGIGGVGGVLVGLNDNAGSTILSLFTVMAIIVLASYKLELFHRRQL